MANSQDNCTNLNSKWQQLHGVILNTFKTELPRRYNESTVYHSRIWQQQLVNSKLWNTNTTHETEMEDSNEAFRPQQEVNQSFQRLVDDEIAHEDQPWHSICPEYSNF